MHPRLYYADNLALPFALLAARTFLPPAELILDLKPWTFFLCLFFGWNVIFIVKHPLTVYVWRISPYSLLKTRPLIIEKKPGYVKQINNQQDTYSSYTVYISLSTTYQHFVDKWIFRTDLLTGFQLLSTKLSPFFVDNLYLFLCFWGKKVTMLFLQDFFSCH